MIGMKQASTLASNQLEAKNAEIKKLSKKIEGSLKDVSVAKADLMNEQKEVSILSKKNHQLQKEIESLRLSLENSMAENSFEKKMNSNQTAEREEEKISSVGYLIPLQAHEDMILEMNTLKHENAILANCLSKIDLQQKCSEGIQTDIEDRLKSEGTAELRCLRAIVVFSKELETAERKAAESTLRGEKHPQFENFLKNPKRNQMMMKRFQILQWIN
jgi:hypothetical protein